MPPLRTYLNADLIPRDAAMLEDIVAQGIKTDSSLIIDPNAAVAKTNGRVQRPIIDSLLNRVVFPSLLRDMPAPVRASDLYQQAQIRTPSRYCSTGWKSLDRLLGGKGWMSGQVNEICGPLASGKTHVCISTMVNLILADEHATAFWIDTLEGGFSAQRMSEAIRNFITKRGSLDVPHDEEQVSKALSRIQVVGCQDVYELVDAIESIGSTISKAKESGTEIPQLVVIDPISELLTGILRIPDGIGHATMMHAMRRLRSIAQEFNTTVLVTTSTVQILQSEEHSPSILLSTTLKPGLGTSWRFTSDLQLYLSRFEASSLGLLEDRSGALKRGLVDPNLFQEDNDTCGHVEEKRIPQSSQSRIAEVMRSKRLKIGEWCIFNLQQCPV